MPSFPRGGMQPHAGGRQNGGSRPQAASGFAPDPRALPQSQAANTLPQSTAAMHSIFAHAPQNPQNMGYAAPVPDFIQMDNNPQAPYAPAQPQQQRQPAPQDERGQTQNREQNRGAAVLPAARFFRLEKNYGCEAAFSCCYRYWQAADARRRFLHGYGLSFTIAFAAQSLDKSGQIIESAALKPVQAWLQKSFDHKILLAADDPARPVFQNMAQAGLCDVRIMPYIGCEAFAYFVWQNADAIARQISRGRVRAESAAVCEQGGDTAILKADNLFPPA